MSRPVVGAGISSGRLRAQAASESGQSLILAIIAMFLLTFLGGVFIAMLARNMMRTERHAGTLNAQYLAEAGVRYADSQLTYGPEGADWRPVPDNLRWVPNQPLDPDFRWLRPYAPVETGNVVPGTNGLREMGPSGGFTRVQLRDGRYLIRVTYNPSNTVLPNSPIAPDVQREVRLGEVVGPTPLSKYIIIESVGREGLVDPQDPTTFRQTNLRRELIALKPIGITDYVRFITNKSNESLTATLGVSPFLLTDGRVFEAEDPANPKQRHQHNLGAYYGPIRVNGNLQWKGRPRVYLNVGFDAQGNPIRFDGRGTSPFRQPRGDAIEVAGRVTYADDRTQVRVVNGEVRGQGDQAYPSEHPLFRTLGGLYRDGAPQTDANGLPRGITRLEPPDLEAEEPGTRLTRWRLLTRNSPVQIPGFSGAAAAEAAAAGLGSGIYIDNRRERQLDTPAFTLKDDWLQPGNTVTANWRGHIYRPPGVQIVLMPGPLALTPGTLLDGIPVTPAEATGQDALGNPALVLAHGAVRITRTDARWLDRTGKDSGQFTQYFQYPLAPGEPLRVPNRLPTFQNGVIFAEGNIRVRGKLPQDRRVGNVTVGTSLTLVSGGTIYIEGSVLKGEPHPDDPERLRRSAVALLARDYVAVNATAYFAGLPDSFAGDWNKSGTDWYTALYLPPHDRYDLYVRSAVPPQSYPVDNVSFFGGTGNSVRQYLLIQHTAESYPGTQVALLVNGQRHPQWSPYSLFTVRNTWAYDVLPLLDTNPPLPWAPNPLVENWLELRYQPAVGDEDDEDDEDDGLTAPYWLSKVAVVPLDVRIEAAIYAMDRSFFIIPGVPFNTLAKDTRGLKERNGHRAVEIAPTLSEDARDKYAYPFYNEPLDIKVTVVGSIAENRPAGEQAEEAWTRLWGWTPLTKSSGADTAHGGDGLAYEYDASFRGSLRFDSYGRPLPLAPRLPVSPDLVYFGEVSG